MPRFFISQTPQGNQVVLTDKEMHHLVHVYRASPGMQVVLFDAAGNEYQAQVTTYNKKEVHLLILTQEQQRHAGSEKILLAQALLKSKSWDLLLQKSMELGLEKLLPVISEHIAAGPETAGRYERWQKVLLAAAKQCGRNNILHIATPQKFATLLQETAHVPLRILAHNDNQLPSLKKVLTQYLAPQQQVLVIVGPEGGFSKQELQQAQSAGVILFSLGYYTLRAETAALSLLATLNFYYSD